MSHHQECLTGLHVGIELESLESCSLHFPCGEICRIPIDIKLPLETPGGVRIGHTGCEAFESTHDAGAFLCWRSIGSYTCWGLRWPRTASPGGLHCDLGSALLGPWGLRREWGSALLGPRSKQGSALLGPWSKWHGSGRRGERSSSKRARSGG